MPIIIDPAKPSAANAAALVPPFKVSRFGRVIIRIPIKPIKAVKRRGFVNASPKKNSERSKIQIGTVNSNAKTWTRGITLVE